jgi:hypothetical protein
VVQGVLLRVLSYVQQCVRIFGSLHLISIAYTTSNGGNTVSYLVFATGLPQYTYGLDLAHGVRMIVPASICVYMCIFIFIFIMIRSYGM